MERWKEIFIGKIPKAVFIVTAKYKNNKYLMAMEQ